MDRKAKGRHFGTLMGYLVIDDNKRRCNVHNLVFEMSASASGGGGCVFKSHLGWKVMQILMWLHKRFVSDAVVDNIPKSPMQKLTFKQHY